MVSKQLEVFYVIQLARALDQSKEKPAIILNMLNPGLCWSNFFGNDGPVSWIMTTLLTLIARQTEVGSRTLVAAAVAGPESHGQYMSDGVVKP